MSIRIKTRNRLVLLLSVAVVGAGALAGAYYARRGYLNAWAMRERAAGMASVKSEDYAAGLSQLGHYLGRFLDKPEGREARYADALFNYALARQMVEEPKSAHLVNAVSLWKRYLALRPENAEARHKLLDAQLSLGWIPEALDNAQEILKTEPKDLKSLQVEAQVFGMQRKYPEALAAAKAWAGAYPHDLDAHLTVIQVMAAQDQEHAADNFAKYAAERLAGEPNAPCFELLASIAADQGIDLKDKKATGDKITRSATLAQAAAAGDLSDAAIVQRLIHQLDALWVQSIIIGSEKELGLAGKGLELARQTMNAHPDDLEYQRIYALRLLQTGNHQQVASLLAKTAPDSPRADGRLLAIKAWAEFNLGLKKEAEALLAAAAQRGQKDPALAALCDAMRAVFVAPSDVAAALVDLQAAYNNPAATMAECKSKLRAFMLTQSDNAEALADLRKMLDDPATQRGDIKAKVDAYFLARAKVWEEACKVAAAKAPADPLVEYLLSEAGLRAGDADTLAKALGQTVGMAPAWVQANVRFAQLAASTRQTQGAAQYADLAHALAPDDPNLLAFDTLISASAAAPGQAEPINKALTLLNELQRRFPDKISPDTKQQIALQLSRLGRNDDAIQLLATANLPAQTQNAARPGNDALLLARIYTTQKRYPEAQALYDQLLAQTPTLDVIMYAADLAGTLGQKDKVGQIMARLDDLQLQGGGAGGRDMVWADYYSRHGTPQQALDSWLAALKANPDNAAAWRLLLAFCLKTGKTDSFDGAAAFLTHFADARKAVPPIPALSTLVPLQDKPGRMLDRAPPSLLEEMCQDLFMRPLIVALLESPGNNDSTSQALAKCLETLADSQAKLDAAPVLDAATVRPIQDQLIPVLQKLVDNNPGVLPIQNFLVGFYGLSEHYDQCVAMAIHTMGAFPDNPGAPAQTAIRVLAAAGRWDEVLAVAKEWRQRSPLQPMAADLAIADAYINLRKPNDAIAQLTDPYLNEIKQGKKTPDDYDQVYVRYLQALQSDAAAQAAAPLLKDRRWRILWMQLMANMPDDKSAAASLQKLDAAIPAEANDERVTLALTWDIMASRTKVAAYETTALNLLDALNGDPTSRQYLQDFGKRILAAPQDNAGGVALWAHWILAKNPMADAQRSLRPLLDSINGRLAWINLAADIPDPNAAAQWLDAAGAALTTATDSASAMISQKTQLAEALKVLADRATTPAALKTSCLKTAAALLEPIDYQNGANRQTQTLLAILYENQENYAAATDVYRRMLKANANDMVAMNNLASVLAKMKRPADGPEAINLISQAITLQPKVPSFYDTQATVYAILGQDYPNALRSIQQAIALEPANLDWRVSRIWILALSGQRTTATTEFGQIQKDQDLSLLSPDSRQKLKEAQLR